MLLQRDSIPMFGVIVIVASICLAPVSFAPLPILAQQRVLNFEPVLDDHPLSVWSDRDAFVWIRLVSEEVIYDGNAFVPIDEIWPELLRIPRQRLPNISGVDASGAIWLGAAQNLARSSGRSGPLEFVDLGDDGSEIATYQAFLLDAGGRVWLGSTAGLLRYDPKTSGFKRYRHDESDPRSISDDWVTSLAQDSSGSIWIGTINGISRLEDEQTGRFKRYRYKPPPHLDAEAESYADAPIFVRLHVDHEGRLWAIAFRDTGVAWRTYSFSGDLVVLDSITDTFKPVFPELNGTVTGFDQDRTGRYWIGTKDDLFTLDSTANTLTRVVTRWKNGSRLGSSTGSLFVDGQDILWLSTSEGLGKADLRRQTFERYGYDPNDPSGLTQNWINAVLVNEDGTVWVGTDYPRRGQPEGGLTLLDRSTGRFKHYKSDPDDPNTLSSNAITALERAAGGKLWVGTIKGLDLFDPITGRVERYYLGGDTLSQDPVNDPALGSTTVTRIVNTESGELWLGTGLAKPDYYRLGVVRVQPGSLALKYYSLDGDTRGLLYHGGTLWIALPDGIGRYDRETDSWRLQVEDESIWRGARGVAGLYADADGVIWLASGANGLWRYDPKVDSLQNYPLGSDRKSRSLGCILEDDYGYLWISSFNGLYRFNRQNENVDHFLVDDGLQGKNFNPGSCHRSASGDLAFGGQFGLNVFTPLKSVANPHPPQVMLTGVNINGIRLKAGFDERLPKSLELADSITLRHSDNNLSFRYTGIHHSKPHDLQFEYKLEGFEKDWEFAGRRRFAGYTNLDPGEYSFRVRAFNQGVPSEQDAGISLVILKPWWETWWAYGLWLLVFVGVLYAGYSFRVRRLKVRSELLENLVAERTHDLEEEKRRTEEQAERLVELDEAKSRFFANISHEFRTPMTLILGPLQDVLDGVHGTVDRRVGEQLGTMRRSAHRMLDLVTQLLDLTRMDAGQLEIHLREVDLIAHLQALVQSFLPLAERQGVTLSFLHDEDKLRLRSDPDMLDKVVGNLLSNAIKFTPEGGNVWVTTRLRSDDSAPAVEISVKDTGLGIPKNELARIFDRFASFEPGSEKSSSWARAHEGIGIGLALARELVELHNGIIFVESIPGFGSTFTVRLPYEPVVSEIEEGGWETELLHPEPSGPGHGDETRIMEMDGATVLIVDDNADVRSYIRTHLGDRYRIIEAANGEEGLEAARAEEPELVIADVMMPVMDGYALCRELKTDEKLRDVPVVLLTAKAGEESTLEGLESGADEYIPKPFSVPEMKARIANLIEGRRRMRSRFTREIVVRPADITIKSEYEVLLNRVMEAIDSHLADNNFSVDWLADELGISTRQLRRRVEVVTGESPGELIRRMRLERASQLLEQHAGTVAEVAYRVGFSSVSHFSKVFKDRFGANPSEYMAPHPDSPIPRT